MKRDCLKCAVLCYTLSQSGRRKIFFLSRPERGQMDYASLHWRKNRAADSNCGEKTASRYRTFETALSSLDFVYGKLRQTPQRKAPQNDARDQMENRNQARLVYKLFFLIEKSDILFHPAIYPLLFQIQNNTL